MFTTSKFKLSVFLFTVLTAGYSSFASAYSCKAVFFEANTLIKKAEKLVTPKTDSRIISIIEEAKGLAKSGLVSHDKANQNHHGKVGKFAHSDSVRRGKWAVSLAKQALFLLTGVPPKH